MKKIYLLNILSFYLCSWSYAQTITSISYNPVNPTSNDSIQFIVQCDFNYSACSGTGYYNGVTGNEVSAGGLHCIGTFAALCTAFDTVMVPPMPNGTYSFTFVLVTMQLPSCVPGIFPLVVDTVNFTVSGGVGIQAATGSHFMQVLPNPSQGSFVLDWKDVEAGEATLKIFSSPGNLLKTMKIIGGINRINTDLAPGLYFLMIEQENGNRVMEKLLIINN